MSTASNSVVCELVGLLRDAQFQRWRLILQELAVERHAQNILPHVLALPERDFLAQLERFAAIVPLARRREHAQRGHPFVIAVVNATTTTYIGDEDALLALVVEHTQLARSDVLAIAAFGGDRDVLEHATQHALAEETLQRKAESAAKLALYRARQLAGNPLVYLTFAIDGVALPRVELELFHRQCPQTSSNFVAFCQSRVPDVHDDSRLLSYKDNPVHRVVRNAWIQAGDVSNNGKGDGPCRSLYGRSFPDESFTISHDAPGILSMASDGPHTNGSQFFITLAPLPYLDRNKVAFGRVVSGFHTIRTIGSLETLHARPCVPCHIVDCGVIEATLD